MPLANQHARPLPSLPLSTAHFFMLSIAVNNQQSRLRVDKRLLKKAVRSILEDAEIESRAKSASPWWMIRRSLELHAEFLDDDSPTDVHQLRARFFARPSGRRNRRQRGDGHRSSAGVSIGRRKKNCCSTSSTASCIWSATMIQPRKLRKTMRKMERALCSDLKTVQC